MKIFCNNNSNELDYIKNFFNIELLLIKFVTQYQIIDLLIYNQGKEIRFGRCSSNELYINDAKASRFQGLFVLKDRKWHISDGLSLTCNKTIVSRNGIWKLFKTKKFINIQNGQKFEINNKIFKI